MTNKEYARIISKNLKRIFNEHGKTQVDVSKDLGYSTSAISSWMTGARIPKMETIDTLCHYFNCRRVDIMEEYAPKPEVPPIIYDVLKTESKDRLVEYAKRLMALEAMEK